MENIEKYIWYLPLLSFLFSIISLLIPIATRPNGEILWICGLGFTPQYGLALVQKEFLSLFSFLSTIIILFSCYAIIKMFMDYRENLEKKRENKNDISKYWLLWIIIGIFLLIAIYFYISFDFWDRFDFIWDFWSAYTFNGAIIFLYVAGSLMILSGILLKLLKTYNYL
ncbi:MAG: hypothetical protein GF317_17045 [Candidatus Lokiarchaeota archaeon]|nr:hypothetical protein [Candidatus Lokiarchaeota archaeon]MBD3201226.1 hypothetical protein [Candidatus Lokiarchaeota archaeon]